MNHRFDLLARALTSRVSRRAAVAAVFGFSTADAASGKRKRRVVSLGAACAETDRCRSGSCQRNICTCGVGERRCGDRCITSTACCVNGDCQRAPNGSPCSQPKCLANRTCGLSPLPAGIPCGIGDSEICDGGGHCVARRCSSVSDCPTTTGYCRSVACLDGLCTARSRSFGDPLPSQVAGDCLSAVCDGAGGTTHIPDDADAPATTHPCVATACENGSVVRTTLPPGTACGQNRTCNASGACA